MLYRESFAKENSKDKHWKNTGKHWESTGKAATLASVRYAETNDGILSHTTTTDS
eukprot:m.5942 g.5942  ORF g.5942 m.5942 type:complete len:55 (+) comp4587_c0_seq1:99-263(+)